MHRVGRHDRFKECEQAAGHADERGGDYESDQFVMPDWVPREQRALLILADGDQHAAERRTHDPEQYPCACENGDGGKAVEHELVVQVDRAERRASDTAQAGLAAGKFGPAKREKERERRERQRQQRKIDAAPAQGEKADDEAEQRGGRHSKQ